jgi:hypothetical protein
LNCSIALARRPKELHLLNVVRVAGDKRGSPESVHLARRIALHAIEHRGSDIAADAHRRL